MSTKKFSKEFKAIVRIFFYWRFLTLIIAWAAVTFLPINENFTFIQWINPFSALIKLWSNFDGVHYLNLARYGYGSQHTGFTQAFFPLYPLLIHYLSFPGKELITALVISHLTLLAAIYFLFKLVSLDFPAKVGKYVVLSLLVFPTSFFLVSAYNEALFMLLSLSAFYCARRNKLLSASLLAALASATRLVGIFLLPALLIEYLKRRKENKEKIFSLKIFPLLLAPAGLLLYMFYLNKTTGDPFYFAHIQPLVSSGRNVSQLVSLPQVFFRYLKMMIYIDHSSFTFFVSLLELLTATLFLTLSLLTFRLRLSYGVFSFLCFILPTLTGTFSSLPRYVLTIFPAFIILGKWLSENRFKSYFFYLFCFLALVVNLILYSTGHFIG